MNLFKESEIKDHPEKKTCKTCRLKFKRRHHDRSYYKCVIKGETRGAGTDIRLKDPACLLYQEMEHRKKSYEQGICDDVVDEE